MKRTALLALVVSLAARAEELGPPGGAVSGFVKGPEGALYAIRSGGVAIVPEVGTVGSLEPVAGFPFVKAVESLSFVDATPCPNGSPAVALSGPSVPRLHPLGARDLSTGDDLVPESLASRLRSVVRVPIESGCRMFVLAGSTLEEGTFLSRSDDGRVFVRVGIPSARTLDLIDDVILVADRTKVWRSTDAGQSFRAQLPLESPSGAPANIASFSGTGPRTVFLATDLGPFRSTDAGVTWTLAATGIRPEELPAGLAFVAAPDGRTVFLQTVGALYGSTDDGVSWTPLPNAPMNSTPSVRQENGRLVLRVASSAGVQESLDGGTSFRLVPNGRPSSRVGALLTLDDGTLLAGTSSPNGIARLAPGETTWTTGGALLDGETVDRLAQSGGIVISALPSDFRVPRALVVARSTDQGRSFMKAQTGLPAVFVPFDLAASPQAFFVAGFDVSTGETRLHVSRDGGLTWTRAGTTAQIYRVAVSGNDVVASGYETGPGYGTYLSANGGATFTRRPAPVSTNAPVPGPLLLSGGSIFSSWSDPSDPARAGLFRSDDGGATWRPLPKPSGTPALEGPSVLLDLDGIAYAGWSSGGLFFSRDRGASFSLAVDSGSVRVNALARRGNAICVATPNRGVLSFDQPLVTHLVLPVVLDVEAFGARYTTELSLLNRGSTPVRLALRYTPSFGSRQGGGVVEETLAPRSQRIVPDAIAYLRSKGLEIPPSEEGAQGGTLVVTFDAAPRSDVFVTARTTTPAGAGRAGLAYAALDARRAASTETLRLSGLLVNERVRSNVAVFNASAEPVTLRVTAHESGSGRTQTLFVAELQPYELRQEPFAQTGWVSGWVSASRVAGTGRFSAYAVVNDNVTNDGSFLGPQTGAFLEMYRNVPVLVESAGFSAELVLTNTASLPAGLTLVFTESLASSPPRTVRVPLTLSPFEQRVLPDAIDALRSAGAALGPRGAASYVGRLRVEVSGVPVSAVSAAARTTTPAGYGLFTPATPPGEERTDGALIPGLVAGNAARANAAFVNTGETGPITLQVLRYGVGGSPIGEPVTLELPPGAWRQLDGVLEGAESGWLEVRRTSGSARWLAYGIVNDGAAPGRGTGDGAFVASEEIP